MECLTARTTMDTNKRQQLDRFFTQLEKQAYQMAYFLTRNRDDALELVQDSMLKLVQSYADKPAKEWKLLFFRILQNRIRDFHRRQSLSRLFNVFGTESDKADQDQINEAPDNQQKTPQQCLQQSSSLKQINNAIITLPLRQQQTFLLRAWQEFSTKETAYALSISEGSVKTHYSRALRQLRHLLGDSYEQL